MCERRYTDSVIMELHRTARSAPPAPPDLTDYYRHVGRQIARLPRAQHAAELGRLVAWLERCGVAVPEVWRCSLDDE